MRWIQGLLFVLFGAMVAEGSLTQVFKVDGSDPNSTAPIGTMLTVTYAGLVADGITFDATLSVSGSGTINQSGSGIGVGGTARLNDGESLSFSMAVSNPVGGTVSFLGFSSINFNNFSAAEDGARFSHDSSLASSDPQAISGLPQTFTLTAEDLVGAGASASFSIDDVTGGFAGVAVPEASSLLYLLLLGSSTLMAKRLRNRRKVDQQATSRRPSPDTP